MTHTDIAIILVTMTITSTLGVYVVIKKISQYTTPPVNTLVRPGDIELGDYIIPTRPSRAYNNLDLLQQTYEGSIPPSYHTNDGFYINCCLENSMHLDYIL
jgi:hypothetical protein